MTTWVCRHLQLCWSEVFQYFAEGQVVAATWRMEDDAGNSGLMVSVAKNKKMFQYLKHGPTGACRCHKSMAHVDACATFYRRFVVQAVGGGSEVPLSVLHGSLFTRPDDALMNSNMV